MSREYHQFCGLARALEIVGGRWALLIVRDLLGGPKRFTDLQEGLPGIPSNVLSARLRELEEARIVGRRVLPRPSTGVAYELTEYGRELEDSVIRLGLWGARSMVLRDGDFYSVHALSLGLRGAFDPAKAKGLVREYELRIDGKTLRISVADGQVSFPTEFGQSPRVVIEAGPDALFELLTGQGIDEASVSGRVRLQGNRTDARRFFEIFRLAPPVGAPMRPAASTRLPAPNAAPEKKTGRKTPARR